MKVVGLISGGKDSSYNLLKCVEHGHEIVALAHLRPPLGVLELDSFMYQSVGSEHVRTIATQCYGLPFHEREIRGKALNQQLQYQETPEDEVEDLYELLKDVKRHHPDVEAVSSGAIKSTYQKLRVEEVCARLSLCSLAYLWDQDQFSLLDGMIASGIDAVLIKTAVRGLNEAHLGKTLTEVRPDLVVFHRHYGLNPCGEGGEYETLTLDSPLYKCGKLLFLYGKIHCLKPDDMAPVLCLQAELHYVPKDQEQKT
jgi:diphthine-ammonia ligase